MTSPKEYRRRLQAQGLSRIEATASSIEEAKNVRKELTIKQKQLHLIKSEIHNDVRTLRQDYASRSRIAGPIFGSAKLVGQLRANAKQRLKMDRDRVIEPYETLKDAIDDLLVQLDAGKLRLDQYIARQQGILPPAPDMELPQRPLHRRTAGSLVWTLLLASGLLLALLFLAIAVIAYNSVR